MPGSDISEVLCQIGHHAYQPHGITTEDKLGLTPVNNRPGWCGSALVVETSSGSHQVSSPSEPPCSG